MCHWVRFADRPLAAMSRAERSLRARMCRWVRFAFRARLVSVERAADGCRAGAGSWGRFFGGGFVLHLRFSRATPKEEVEPQMNADERRWGKRLLGLHLRSS